MSLNRHGPAARPGPGHVGGARVVLLQRGTDAREVEAEVVGDHEELVGGRELDVAPRVREQLGELGLLDVEVDDRRARRAEQLRRPRARARSVRADDDLRQRRAARPSPCPRRCARGRTTRRWCAARPLTSCSTIAVTPGYTVLRSTRCWPSRSWSSRPSIACTALGSGFRCSSTGVPTTTMTCSAVRTERVGRWRAAVRRRDLAQHSCAPGSSKGGCRRSRGQPTPRSRRRA